jgi:cyclic pyranopterin phosphate synthase
LRPGRLRPPAPLPESTPEEATTTSRAPGKIAYRGKDAIYVNITNRCSSACEFCLREFTDDVYGEPLRLDEEPPVEQIEQAVELEFLDGLAAEVAFCGFGEPTMRLDAVLAVTDWLRLRRIASRLVTNGHGQLLNPDVDVADALASAGLGAVTISLNAADPQTYDLICRPIFSKTHRAVIRFAEECVGHGLKTTLTAVDYPGADIDGCKAIAAALGAEFRLRGLVRRSDRESATQKEAE